MIEDFNPPLYENDGAMDFVVAAYNAGFEPFHFESRETLYFGPAVIVEEPGVENAAEVLDLPSSELMIEEHGVGNYAVHPEQSSKKKRFDNE